MTIVSFSSSFNIDIDINNIIIIIIISIIIIIIINTIIIIWLLKPMDSFGTWQKWKLIYFLMQNFIKLYEVLMPC